ncbi:MAG: PAS domain-containing protein [Proteobacteria bacterium]|nr:PAS domain-containing protein [Pseudomonadota bacterium]
MAGFIDYAALPTFFEVLRGISEAHPRQVRRVGWQGAELDPEGDTSFARLSGPGSKSYVLLTLPAWRQAPPAPALASAPAAEPSKLVDWLKLSLRAAHMYAWRWHRKIDEFELLLSNSPGRESPEPGFQGMEGLFACLHPEDLDRVSRSTQLALEEGMDLKEEFRLRGGDGSYRWYAAVGRPIMDEFGEVTGLVGATQDVTSRRLSLARLSEYSELLRSAAANTRDVLLLLDRNLNIRFCNHNIRGVEPRLLVGQSVRNVLGEPNWPLHSKLLAAVVANGEPASFAHEATGENDELHKYDSRAIPTYEGGRISGVSLTISDITERLRMEREVLEISAREQERIGQDLHDGLGQELTGVSLMLRGLATRLGRSDPELAQEVNEIIRVVNLSIEGARSLARGLSPFNNSRGGLVRALRSLAARSRDLYGLNVRFRSKVWPQLTLDENQSSHLYRIAQEALTNVARHARASHAEIRLQVADGRFILTIGDDGVGLENVCKSGNGMGLKLMAYRAGMIGAKLEILANHPKGTAIRICGEQPPVT